MRLLYLTDISLKLPTVDYLPDQLYHGLVAVLGVRNVIDYPSKPGKRTILLNAIFRKPILDFGIVITLLRKSNPNCV